MASESELQRAKPPEQGLLTGSHLGVLQSSSSGALRGHKCPPQPLAIWGNPRKALTRSFPAAKSIRSSGHACQQGQCQTPSQRGQGFPFSAVSNALWAFDPSFCLPLPCLQGCPLALPWRTLAICDPAPPLSPVHPLQPVPPSNSSPGSSLPLLLGIQLSSVLPTLPHPPFPE